MNLNPYVSPRASQESSSEIVDRQQREEVATIVRRFLTDELTAFQFDEALDSDVAHPFTDRAGVSGATTRRDGDTSLCAEQRFVLKLVRAMTVQEP